MEVEGGSAGVGREGKRTRRCRHRAEILREVPKPGFKDLHDEALEIPTLRGAKLEGVWVCGE